eukprot:3495222-Rhodomonas_salina.6
MQMCSAVCDAEKQCPVRCRRLFRARSRSRAVVTRVRGEQARMIQQNRTLTKLNLNGNSIRKKGAVALFGALTGDAKNPPNIKLKELDLQVREDARGASPAARAPCDDVRVRASVWGVGCSVWGALLSEKCGAERGWCAERSEGVTCEPEREEARGRGDAARGAVLSERVQCGAEGGCGAVQTESVVEREGVMVRAQGCGVERGSTTCRCWSQAASTSATSPATSSE